MRHAPVADLADSGTGRPSDHHLAGGARALRHPLKEDPRCYGNCGELISAPSFVLAGSNSGGCGPKLASEPVPQARKVMITTERDQFSSVHCRHCGDLNPEATRERARQHVRSTGHTVIYVTENATTYEPSPDNSSRE